jgi:hypothetical protein
MRRSTGLLLIALAASMGSVAWALWHPWREVPLPALRVEVLNGCGENQLASRAAAALRGLGLDVVSVGDADREDYPRTILVDRAGKPALTRRLAAALGPVLVVLERVDDPVADVTLILGRDHRQLRLEGRGRP